MIQGSGSINVDLNVAEMEPSPEFLSSSQLTKKFNPLTEREGNRTSVGDMKENNFLDKVYSLFTTHHSLKSAAFTLAEVLVTLGIIGVVSAMTVPTLIQNYQRQSYVTQLHKVYNEMSQAVLKYQTDKNAVNLREAGLGSQTEVNNFIHNYFKVVKDCGSDIPSCFASGNYRKLDGVKYPNYDNANDNQNSYILASGAAIGVQAFSDASRNIVMQIAVDTNGKKGPNIVGRDFFAMYVYNNGVIDEYSVSDDEGTYENVTAPLTQEQRERNFQVACNSNKPSWGHGCFGKILNDNWEMTY